MPHVIPDRTGLNTPDESIPSQSLDEIDFFISYTHSDTQEAEWISWVLTSAGYSTYFQKWDIRPGHNFVLQMHSALICCKRLIAVLSPQYLKSNYPYPEWASAFSNDPKGDLQKFVPIIVKECKPEGLLGQIVYIDVTDCWTDEEFDEQEAEQKILEGIEYGRQLPKTKPSFATPHTTGQMHD